MIISYCKSRYSKGIHLVVLFIGRSDKQKCGKAKNRDDSNPKFWYCLLAFGKIMDKIQLWEDHITELQKTPFWYLFEAFIRKRVIQRQKHADLTMRILQHYKVEQKSFILNSANMII